MDTEEEGGGEDNDAEREADYRRVLEGQEIITKGWGLGNPGYVATEYI